MTLVDRYERISKNSLHESFEDSEAAKEMKKRHREKLLGPDLIAAVPFEYTLTEYEKKYPDWHEMELVDQGRYIAHEYLKNMEELIKEHLREIKRQAEARKKKSDDD